MTEFKPLDPVLVDGKPALFQKYDERNARPGRRPTAWVKQGDFVLQVPVQRITAAPREADDEPPPERVVEQAVVYDGTWSEDEGVVTVIRTVLAGVSGPHGDYEAASLDEAADALFAAGFLVCGEWKEPEYECGSWWVPLSRMAGGE